MASPVAFRYTGFLLFGEIINKSVAENAAKSKQSLPSPTRAFRKEYKHAFRHSLCPSSSQKYQRKNSRYSKVKHLETELKDKAQRWSYNPQEPILKMSRYAFTQN